MVTVYIDKPELENDMAEVIRAHLGITQIQNGSFDTAEGYAVEALIDDGGVRVRAKSDTKSTFCQVLVKEKGENELEQKRYAKRAFKMAVYRSMQELERVCLPWGALTGIRPTKLLREYISQKGETEAFRIFTDDFDVNPDKAALALEIIKAQAPVLGSAKQNELDVYIGIPFCKSRCLYCSFASLEMAVPGGYMDALHKDIESGSKIARDGGYKPRAMYIGGGTPTILSADELERLITHALTCYGDIFIELNVEAGRADTIDEKKLAALKNAGVSRICLNPQSMNEDTLKRMGRAHTPQEFIKAYNIARNMGFSNINTDIIAGLPGESMADFNNTLEQIIKLSPDSLTVHTLAIKRSSRLKEKLDEYPLPSHDEAAQMLALSDKAARELDLRPYYLYRQKYMRGSLENVGYAKEGMECVYNIDMMEDNLSIMAHGAGAMTKRVFHGRNQRIERIPAPKDILTYEKKLLSLDEQKRRLFL